MGAEHNLINRKQAATHNNPVATSKNLLIAKMLEVSRKAIDCR